MISSLKFCVKNVRPKNIRTYFNYRMEKNKDREARMLNKMFTKEMRKKNLGVPSEAQLKVSVLEHDTHDSSNRRGTALNKVYMEHMTELIQSGKHSGKILEEGIEVTKVRLTKGGNYINIYWTCNNENLTEEDIASLLEPATKELQEQMGSIRYVSITPFVRFVRDVNMEKAQTVERILKSADFGNDYEPVYPESVITPDCNVSEDGLPQMRQDVFGVDHAKIRAKILTAIEIHKVVYSPKENEFEYVEMENLVPFDKKVFAKFYKRKQILDKKLTSRGLYGVRGSKNVEEEEEEEDEDNDYAKEFWEAVKKEEEEEEREYAKDYQN